MMVHHHLDFTCAISQGCTTSKEEQTRPICMPHYVIYKKQPLQLVFVARVGSLDCICMPHHVVCYGV